MCLIRGSSPSGPASTPHVSSCPVPFTTCSCGPCMAFLQILHWKIITGPHAPLQGPAHVCTCPAAAHAFSSWTSNPLREKCPLSILPPPPPPAPPCQTFKSAFGPKLSIKDPALWMLRVVLSPKMPQLQASYPQRCDPCKGTSHGGLHLKMLISAAPGSLIAIPHDHKTIKFRCNGAACQACVCTRPNG